jgi:hypothetical protein
MIPKQLSTWLVAAAVVIASACGGGDGGGIGGTGSPVAVSYGGVTAKGSVWVNGVEFQTTRATIRIDDQTFVGDDRLVKVGMVVQVDGSIADKVATAVTVEGSIKGFVEAVGTDQLTVMGQTVRTDDRTVYDNGVPLAGDRVEVHGLVVADGVLQGGHVSKQTTAPTPAFAVKGYAKNVSAAAGSFSIGTLRVNYPGALPLNGQFVEAKGNACAASPVCGTLTASRVSASGLRVDNSAQAEVEGFVTAAGVVGGEFTIGNQRVATSAGTVYVGGTLGDILPGTQLEVEGTISNGVLAARKLAFKDSVRIEADVATRVGATLTFNGLPGVSVTANAFTDLRDFGGSAAAITPPTHVRLRGRPAPGNSVVALLIEGRGNASTAVGLQATVSAVNGSTLTLLGVPVDTASIAIFRDALGNPITRAQFLAAARPNVLVKAKGTRADATTVNWAEIELED